jgi:hypothetical protein
MFVTHHGIPDCGPIRPDGTATCDLYVGSSSGGRSNVVLGRIDFKPIASGSEVALRVQSYASNKDKILVAWEKMVMGRKQEACPK